MSGRFFLIPKDTMTIRHISCDLWGTLMISNRIFSEQRAVYLQNCYFKDQTVPQVSTAIQEIGDRADTINMNIGTSIPAEDLYRELFRNFGVSSDRERLEEVMLHIEDLFLEYPPHLINSYVLEDLRYCLGCVSLSIGSNTAFIKGQTLLKTFNQYGLDDIFSFCVFSDEIGCSKPHKDFFASIYARLNPNITKRQVAHIGDSERADLLGAKAFGFHSLVVDLKKDRLANVCNTLLTAPTR